MNHYTADGVRERSIVFDSEAIENIPPGYRARETYIVTGPDRFAEGFEIAPPGKDFELYSETQFRRIDRGAN